MISREREAKQRDQHTRSLTEYDRVLMLTARLPWYMSRLVYHEHTRMAPSEVRTLAFSDVVEINAYLDAVDRETARQRRDMEEKQRKRRS